MSHTKRAFTLIELLVVIAIIAILAAILFPVFAQAKAAAKKTSDLSNQKNVATAHLLYSGDADDVLVANGEDMVPAGSPNFSTMQPYTGQGGNGDAFYGNTIGAGSGSRTLGFMDPNAVQNWGRETQPYIKSMDMMVSPGSSNDSDPLLAPVANNGRAGRTSYVMNGCASRVSQTQFAQVANTILMSSRATTTREAIAIPRRAYFGDGWTGSNDLDNFWIGWNFGRGANYAYADGHARFKPRNSVKWSDYGFWEWVNLEGDPDFGGWTPPSRLPGLKNDPLKPNFNGWRSFGACDVTQTPITTP